MPPLSAKIYAYLAFDFERKGLCFDDLVETFCANKVQSLLALIFAQCRTHQITQ